MACFQDMLSIPHTLPHGLTSRHGSISGEGLRGLWTFGAGGGGAARGD